MSGFYENKMPRTYDSVKPKYFLFSEDKQEREAEEDLFKYILSTSSWMNELKRNNEYHRRTHYENDNLNDDARKKLASKREKNIDAWVREFTG